MTLGGRVSEEIFFGAENITTGAQDDLQKITRLAFEACANYGMNSVVGPVSYGGSESRKESWQKPFSEKTGEMLDAEVRKMIMSVINSCLPLVLHFDYFHTERPMIARATCSPSIARTLRRSLSYCLPRKSSHARICATF